VATPLHTDDKAALNALSRADMQLTMVGLKRFLKRATWIGTTNHYARNVVELLKAALPATPQHKRNLAQYIAASVALHLNDGWSYLGRSVSCLLAGDTHRALHLGYYAELRASMSLLASAGIGIFDKQHFIVQAANSTSKLRFGQGTHVMAWLALEEWSQQAASGALFARLIRPEGRTLHDWFQPLGGASTLAPQARDWFMQWGMDLGLAAKDRDARNQSSYRPDGVPATWVLNAKDGLAFVRDTWRVLEPSATSSFEQIDLHILRLAIERYYVSLSSIPAVPTDPAFVALAERIVLAQSLTSAAEGRIKKFVLRQRAPDDPDIFKYSSQTPTGDQLDVFAIMSRAVLLLRLATGSAHDLLYQAGFDATDLSFWWGKLGEARGLWTAGSPPTALSDLWADIEDGLREIADKEAEDPEAFKSINSVAYGSSGRLNLLASHERVGLWGLCPA
jgi:hypothetical protein